MTQPPPPRADQPDETYPSLAAFLTWGGLADPGLFSRLGIGSIGELGKVRWAGVDFGAFAPATSVCVRLFLQGASVAPAEFDGIPDGAAVADMLRRVGLLADDASRPGRWMCPVLVYPVEGFWVASDRVADTEGRPLKMAPDAVFPGLYPGTLRFLRFLPQSSKNVLDVCGGCGIGAMVAARTARSAVTSDLTERATAFSRFNLRLNGVTNVRSVAAPGYGGVRGELYDMVVAHPPYVPSLGDGAVFRDGGSLGEGVLRELVEGLADHLAPGGRAMFLSFGRSTHEEPWENRLRGWLGPRSAEFDLLVGTLDRKDPRQVAEDIAERLGTGDPDRARDLEERFLGHSTKEFAYGVIYLERRTGGGPAVTESVDIAYEARGLDLLERLDWGRVKARADFPQCLGRMRPRLRASVELHSRHAVQEGSWVAVECLIRSLSPIPATLKIDSSMAAVLTLFDGVQTVAEAYRRGSDGGGIPDGVPESAFAGIVANLADRGFLCFENGADSAK